MSLRIRLGRLLCRLSRRHRPRRLASVSYLNAPVGVEYQSGAARSECGRCGKPLEDEY
jgi:hypothetical protein